MTIIYAVYKLGSFFEEIEIIVINFFSFLIIMREKDMIPISIIITLFWEKIHNAFKFGNSYDLSSASFLSEALMMCLKATVLPD